MARKRHKRRGTYGIPSLGGLESIGFAARVGTKYNIVESLESVEVQPRIEETTRLPVVGKAEVMNQCDYTCHCLDIDGQLGA